MESSKRGFFNHIRSIDTSKNPTYYYKHFFRKLMLILSTMLLTLLFSSVVFAADQSVTVTMNGHGTVNNATLIGQSTDGKYMYVRVTLGYSHYTNYSTMKYDTTTGTWTDLGTGSASNIIYKPDGTPVTVTTIGQSGFHSPTLKDAALIGQSPDGKYMYVRATLGYSHYTYYSTMKYDTTTGTWTDLGTGNHSNIIYKPDGTPVTVATSSHFWFSSTVNSAVLIGQSPDGKYMYVRIPYSIYAYSTMKYDTTTGTWTDLGIEGHSNIIYYNYPSILEVTSSKANGNYHTGDVIDIRVVFSGAVIVTGAPQLSLDTGDTDTVVNYSSGSGTDTLVFDYTVKETDNNIDLDYVDTSSLSLHGGTIKDAAGHNASITLPTPKTSTALSQERSLSYNKDIAINTIAYHYTGSAQSYTIPRAGVYLLSVYGAKGGDYDGYSGGEGGYSYGYITLNAGDVLNFYVGSSGANEGWNGGGQNGHFSAKGGGATDIRLNGQDLTNRIIVAGGGGGAGRQDRGGPGGNAAGVNGLNGSNGGGKYPGYGATQTAGGSRGGGNKNDSCTDGQLGIGGTGAGGGGGGYYGGGGGGRNRHHGGVFYGPTWYTCGGGGGSSYLDSRVSNGYTGSMQSTSDGFAGIAFIDGLPGVIITASTADITNAPSITYTMQFSEAVSGFDASDITVTNGTKGTFTPVDADTYTLVVDNNGTYTQTLNIPAGACTNSRGNGNISGSKTITIDRTLPTITLSAPSTMTGATETITAVITDNDSGIAQQKYALGNQPAGYFATGGTAFTGTTFTVNVPGTYTVYAKDNAGNEAVNTTSIVGTISIEDFTDRVTAANKDYTDAQAETYNKYTPESEVVEKITLDPHNRTVNTYHITLNLADGDSLVGIKYIKVVKVLDISAASAEEITIPGVQEEDNPGSSYYVNNGDKTITFDISPTSADNKKHKIAVYIKYTFYKTDTTELTSYTDNLIVTRDSDTTQYTSQNTINVRDAKIINQ